LVSTLQKYHEDHLSLLQRPRSEREGRPTFLATEVGRFEDGYLDQLTGTKLVVDLAYCRVLEEVQRPELREQDL